MDSSLEESSATSMTNPQTDPAKASSFQDRMASVMDAITAACSSRKRPSSALSDGEYCDDDVRGSTASKDGNGSPVRERRQQWPSDDSRVRSGGRRWKGEGTRESGEETTRAHDSRVIMSNTRAHGGTGGRKRRRNDRGGGRDFRAPSRPDYVVNPAKWTKYDLTNDGTKDLKRSGMNAEQVNKYAAFEFLNALRKDDDNNEGSVEEGETESGGKVVFRKPTRKMAQGGKNMGGDQGGRDGGGGRFVGGVTGMSVMPEYVVGREKPAGGKERERKGRKQLVVFGSRTTTEEKDGEVETKGSSEKIKSSQHCISLSHLGEDEDDSSDDDI